MKLASQIPVHPQERPPSPARSLRSLSPPSPMQSISTHKHPSRPTPYQKKKATIKEVPVMDIAKSQGVAATATRDESDDSAILPTITISKPVPLPRMKKRTPKNAHGEQNIPPKASSSRVEPEGAEDEEPISPAKKGRKKSKRSEPNEGAARRGTRERKVPARFDDGDEQTNGKGRGTGRGRGRGRGRK
ncbi:hypothetical protein QCA50_016994 [Cerrena zonata]|uniref:Uncharacterized protein n=1 Tax=Cerrena zonata TaxID=2478898 RepID=A0AAW0FEE7_9APHY